MSRKHTRQPYRPAKREGATQQPAGKPPAENKAFHETEQGFGKRKQLLFAAGVVLITLVLYIPSLFNGWIVNWDDGGYIHEHELVHTLNW